VAHVVAILAFGSLIEEAGIELDSVIVDRPAVRTPFAVEFARLSGSRDGAPTLVPVENGSLVDARLLVLDGSVSLAAAKDMLWRRETRNIGSGRGYREPDPSTTNSVLVRESNAFVDDGYDIVLFVDFADSGKETLDANELAAAALQSARARADNMDGISYLRIAKDSGICTRLTADYEAAILRLTETDSLAEARDSVRPPIDG